MNLCSVCTHPARAAIERALDKRSPRQVARRFSGVSWRALYRHAQHLEARRLSADAARTAIALRRHGLTYRAIAREIGADATTVQAAVELALRRSRARVVAAGVKRERKGAPSTATIDVHRPEET